LRGEAEAISVLLHMAGSYFRQDRGVKISWKY